MYFTKLRLSGLYDIDLPKVGALPSDPYLLESLSMGPVEIDVPITSSVNQGGVVGRIRPHNLEPVVLMGLNPRFALGETAADLRTKIYGLVSPGVQEYITMNLMDVDTIVARAVGYVKKCEVVPFDREPRVQLTVACPESYLEAPAPVFELPSVGSTQTVDYTGTAPTGLVFSTTFTDSLSNAYITHLNSGRVMQFDYDFLSGDVLNIDTRPGSRLITRTRAGVTIDLIGALTSNSSWFTLYPGVNSYVQSNSGKMDWTSFSYTPRYWGF